jgi:hypothetical protein
MVLRGGSVVRRSSLRFGSSLRAAVVVVVWRVFVERGEVGFVAFQAPTNPNPTQPPGQGFNLTGEPTETS